MEGDFASLEKGSTAEAGQDCCHAFGHVSVPQFQRATPFFLPLFIDVNDEIEAAMGVVRRVKIEIGVDVQVASTCRTVQSAAFKRSICIYWCDACDFF